MEGFPNNTVVVYEGGGYSGCLWEYNAFLVDRDGDFVDLMSSGHAGLYTEKDAVAALVGGSPSVLEGYNAHQVHLGSEESVAEFSEIYNASLVLHILNLVVVGAGYAAKDLKVTCGTCGGSVYPDADSCIPVNMVCDGGIAYSFRDIMCEECASARRCDECAEHMDEPIPIDDESLERVCGFCKQLPC